jgi:hypothetical protein
MDSGDGSDELGPSGRAHSGKQRRAPAVIGQLAMLARKRGDVSLGVNGQLMCDL